MHADVPARNAEKASERRVSGRHELRADGLGIGAAPVFRPLTDLSGDDLLSILRRVHAQLEPHLDDEPDIDPGVVPCVQLSLQTSLRAMRPAPQTAPLAVRGFGMNLHAASVVDGRDRRRLERVCRYLLRPAFSLEAVQWLDDGRVRLHMPRRGSWVDTTPEQFIGKLAALVPPPRFHMAPYRPPSRPLASLGS